MRKAGVTATRYIHLMRWVAAGLLLAVVPMCAQQQEAVGNGSCDSLAALAQAGPTGSSAWLDAWTRLLRDGCITDIDSALRVTRRVQAEALEDTVRQVAVIRAMAEVFFAHGNKRAGIAEMENSVPLLDARRAPETYEAVHLRLADHLDETFDLGRSMAHYELALRSKEARSDLRGMAGVLNNIGIIRIKQGDVEGALTLHERCLSIHRSLGDSSRVAATLNRIGVALREADRLTEALERHGESLRIYERLGHAMGMAAALNNLAATYNALGRYDEASDHAARSLAIREREGETFAVGYALIQLARARLHQGRPAEAVEHGERARGIALRIHLHTVEQDACELLHEAYKAAGDATRSLANHERFILLRDSFRTEDNQRAVLRQEYEHKAYETILADSLRHQAERLRMEAEHELERSNAAAQRERIIMVAVALLLLAAAAVYFLLDRRRRRAHSEREQAVLKERLRIADDLHDDLGSGLSTLRLRGELALRKVNDPDLRGSLMGVSSLASELAQNMRSILWAIAPERTTVAELVAYCTSHLRAVLTEHGIHVHVSVGEAWPDREVGAELRRNTFLIIKEAANNVVKHAHAGNVWIEARYDAGLYFSVRDDGKWTPTVGTEGRGLRTMRDRAGAMGGDLSVGPRSGGGTELRLRVPMDISIA